MCSKIEHHLRIGKFHFNRAAVNFVSLHKCIVMYFVVIFCYIRMHQVIAPVFEGLHVCDHCE